MFYAVIYFLLHIFKFSGMTAVTVVAVNSDKFQEICRLEGTIQGKREELLDINNKTNHRTILYDLKKPDYLPTFDQYIGHKKKNK